MITWIIEFGLYFSSWMCRSNTSSSIVFSDWLSFFIIFSTYSSCSVSKLESCFMMLSSASLWNLWIISLLYSLSSWISYLKKPRRAFLALLNSFASSGFDSKVKRVFQIHLKTWFFMRGFSIPKKRERIDANLS